MGQLENLVAADAAEIALGVMSTAGSFETGRSSGSKMALMRARVREAAGTAASGHNVALRFLLAQRNGRDGDQPLSHLVLAENQTHKDLIFIDMPERFYLCAWKKLMWYRHALSAFPRANFFLIADPDAFIQLDHLSQDLRRVQALITSGVSSAPTCSHAHALMLACTHTTQPSGCKRARALRFSPVESLLQRHLGRASYGVHRLAM